MKSTINRPSLLVVLAVIACVQIEFASQIHAAYCGAHCVSRALRQLGVPSPDLTMIIEELNGLTHDSLPDFTMLAQSLRSRNVTAVFVNRDILPQLPIRVPTILHVNNDHFELLDELANDEATIWWGPGDIRRLTWDRLTETTSPIVLLVSTSTSAQIQSDVASAVRNKQLSYVLHWSWIVMIGIFIVVRLRIHGTPLASKFISSDPLTVLTAWCGWVSISVVSKWDLIL